MTQNKQKQIKNLVEIFVRLSPEEQTEALKSFDKLIENASSEELQRFFLEVKNAFAQTGGQTNAD